MVGWFVRVRASILHQCIQYVQYSLGLGERTFKIVFQTYIYSALTYSTFTFICTLHMNVASDNSQHQNRHIFPATENMLWGLFTFKDCTVTVSEISLLCISLDILVGFKQTRRTYLLTFHSCNGT